VWKNEIASNTVFRRVFDGGFKILPRRAQNQPDETNDYQHEADDEHRTAGVGLDFERVIDRRDGIDQMIKSAAFDLARNFHDNFC
jgi:hypothetical protein